MNSKHLHELRALVRDELHCDDARIEQIQCVGPCSLSDDWQ